MATLTRATLGKLTQRITKDFEIGGNEVRIQKPTPLDKSRYIMSMIDAEGLKDPKNIKPDMTQYYESVMRLTAAMWIDDTGKRVFEDHEWRLLNELEPEFYQELSGECQRFAEVAAIKPGESGSTPGSDSLVESA